MRTWALPTEPRTPARTRRLLAAAVAAAAAAGLALALGPAATAAPSSPVAADFNGDGYADLAVGVPDGAVGGKAKAGYVTVLRGGPSGLGKHGSYRITQATPEIPGTPEAGDRFGASVALRDLNGDGVAELLVGAPGEDVTGRGKDAGVVVAVAGSRNGPTHGANVAVGTTAGAAYGMSVAAADLTGDGGPDVVIGGKDKVVLHAVVNRGEDVVLATVLATPMGERAPVLATGDFTADGTDDLAIAYWTEQPFRQSHVRLWTWEESEQGMVNVWNTDNAGVTSLAAGDFDGDGLDDLALGECREIADENIDDPCGPERYALGGGIHIAYGHAGGSFGLRSQTLNQDTPGVHGRAETGDRFGAALAVTDVNGDGRDDLVVGAPGEAIGTRKGAGAVTLLLGRTGGLLDASGKASSVPLNQGTPGVPGAAEAKDAFGAAVTAGDFDRDGRADLAIGSPGENASSGGVWAMPRSAAKGSYALTPKKLGLPSPSSALSYGRTLSGH